MRGGPKGYRAIRPLRKAAPETTRPRPAQWAAAQKIRVFTFKIRETLIVRFWL